MLQWEQTRIIYTAFYLVLHRILPFTSTYGSQVSIWELRSCSTFSACQQIRAKRQQYGCEANPCMAGSLLFYSCCQIWRDFPSTNQFLLITQHSFLPRDHQLHLHHLLEPLHSTTNTLGPRQPAEDQLHYISVVQTQFDMVMFKVVEILSLYVPYC